MKKVLLVDDDGQYQRLLTIELSEAGYTVIPASNGREALSLVEDARPDIIVTDMNMPEVDGSTTVISLLNPKNNKLLYPIIAMSGDSESFASIDHLVNGVFVKSRPVSELLGLIERAL